MASPIPKIAVIVGSTNLRKIEAARKGILSFYGVKNVEVVVIPFKADPGITQWKSEHAPGQPFGARQTAFGAINRMNDCWENRNQLCNGSFETIYAVGFENGLVKPLEVGQSGENWFDICFTAIKCSVPGSPIIIKRGQYVKTEFAPPPNCEQKEFDAAVKTYEARIMPLIMQEIDLYLTWTKDLPNGPKTREAYLTECEEKALEELDRIMKTDQTREDELSDIDSVWNDVKTLIAVEDIGFAEELREKLLTEKPSKYMADVISDFYKYYASGS